MTKKQPYLAYMMAIVGLCLLPVTAVFAQNLGSMTDHLSGQTAGIPVFLSVLAYVMGIIAVISALFKFFDYVSEPDRETLKAGVVRLLIGGLLVLLPYTAEIAIEALGENAAEEGETVYKRNLCAFGDCGN